MDPLLIVFGFGVGILVGMTGMGGGSLMTPLLMLVFGIKPTVAVGSDIAYQAVTKTLGGWRHFSLKTVNFGLALWLAAGSVPGAIGGVYVIHLLKQRYGDAVDNFTYTLLGSMLAIVGAIVLVQALLKPIKDDQGHDEHFALKRWHKITAVAIGLTTGFVIGITSAGSGTVIAVALIAVYRMAPRHVVGTDVFHASILLWAAGAAHWVGGNIDWMLTATLLAGSMPGVYLGTRLSVKIPVNALRGALGLVLMLSASATLNKADVPLVPELLASAAVALVLVGGSRLLLLRGRASARGYAPPTTAGGAAGAGRLPEPAMASRGE